MTTKGTEQVRAVTCRLFRRTTCDLTTGALRCQAPADPWLRRRSKPHQKVCEGLDAMEQQGRDCAASRFAPWPSRTRTTIYPVEAASQACASWRRRDGVRPRLAAKVFCSWRHNNKQRNGCLAPRCRQAIGSEAQLHMLVCRSAVPISSANSAVRRGEPCRLCPHQFAMVLPSSLPCSLSQQAKQASPPFPIRHRPPLIPIQRRRRNRVWRTSGPGPGPTPLGEKHHGCLTSDHRA